MPERIQDVLLALAFLACGGHHILLRLLSLHLCNEYLSLPKKKKKTTACQDGGMVINIDWRQAAKAGGCCCFKATCKCATLVMPAANMEG